MKFLSFSLFVIFCSMALHQAEGACANEPDGTFLPDPTSRSRFIYCWGGVENIGSCDPGFEFNPFDRVCDNVIGGSPSTPGQIPNDVCFNRPDGTFLPDPTSRNRFIYCNNRQSIVGTCNPGQEFNPVESVCENASSNPREPCANRPDGTFLADPSSRQRFLYCSNGQSTPGYCPTNQVFFEEGQYCGPDEAVNPPAPPVRTTTARPQPTTRQTPPTRTTQKPALPTRSSQGPALPTRSSQIPVRPTPTRPSQVPPAPTRRPVPPRAK